jgi:hypothetical protein
MLEIKTSLDWPKSESELKRLAKLMPMFEADFNRIATNIGALVTELSKLEVIARNTKSRSSVDNCESKIKQINEELKQVHKIHLMALLRQ